MTVSYRDKSFILLLKHWKGSVWKAIWLEYIVFLIIYFGMNMIYRYAMNEHDKVIFEKMVTSFDVWIKNIPIQFLLGFYVNKVVSRWWEQLNYISWPDKFLVFLVGNIQGDDEECRKIRRTFARWCNLLAVLVWKEVSVKIKKRFPTTRHVVKAGLMTEHEYEIFEGTTGMHGRWFVPVSWMVNLLADCKKSGKISDYAHQKLLDELYAYKVSAAMLTMYDWINVPLVYTQVVTLATYGYFLLCLIARQSLRYDNIVTEPSYVDIWFPVFTTLEFIFYVGWLKVGENLRCPFGEDDDDFDMNYVLDRNILVGNMLVDELFRQRPMPEKDFYWNEPTPILPHTMASWKVRDKIPNWRLYKFELPRTLAEPYVAKAMEHAVKERKKEKKTDPPATDMEMQKLQ